jgi:hypothetical protein
MLFRHVLSKEIMNKLDIFPGWRVLLNVNETVSLDHNFFIYIIICGVEKFSFPPKPRSAF